jgi:regulator of nonsense transcripts 1
VRPQILVTGYSNIAVNNIMAGLLKHGVRALRVGNGHGMTEDTLQSETERDRRHGDVQRMREMGRYPEAARLLFMIQERILENAEVICATCMTAGSDMLAKRTFSSVLLDEATQSTELATLVPLVDTCQRLVLVGDHRQLPPTILSYKAQLAGLAESLFERFIRLGYPFTMLECQFRMHPTIAEFPAAQWYDGRLQNGVTAMDRIAPLALQWPNRSQPVAFVPVGDERSRQLETKSFSGSKFNPQEAQVSPTFPDLFPHCSPNLAPNVP